MYLPWCWWVCQPLGFCLPVFLSLVHFLGFFVGLVFVSLYLSPSMVALSLALFSFLCFCHLSSHRLGRCFRPFRPLSSFCLGWCTGFFTHLCLVCHFGSPCFEFVSESGCWCPSLIDICPQCPPIVLGRRPTGPFAFACLLWAGSEDFGSHPFVPPTCILVVACGWAGMGFWLVLYEFVVVILVSSLSPLIYCRYFPVVFFCT